MLSRTAVLNRDFGGWALANLSGAAALEALVSKIVFVIAAPDAALRVTVLGTGFCFLDAKGFQITNAKITQTTSDISEMYFAFIVPFSLGFLGAQAFNSTLLRKKRPA